MKRLSLLILSIFLLSGCLHNAKQPVFDDQEPAQTKEEKEIAVDTATVSESVEIVEDNEVLEQENIELPATFDTEVIFVSQAPFGDWGLPYQEACEESSLIMVSKFFNNEPLTKEIMDEEIHKLVAWEKVTLGTYTDTSAEEVVKIIEQYFELKVEVIEEVTVERIKQELVKGNLVVAPFAGRELGNKYFTAPGPLYHMLVIRGYDRDQFITNDVGTRHGEKYKYKYQVLLNAIHDLPMVDGEVFRPYEEKEVTKAIKEELMNTGRKVILSIHK